MSIKDRLAKKTEGLLVPNKNESATGSAPLRTGPGQMLMVNSLMKESNEKLAVLEARLKEFEGTLPVKLIEAEKIQPSRWANRDTRSYEHADFLALKEEIRNAGGNIQPIKVRPLAASSDRYEIVFGHRRHQACLELGLPVLAFVEAVSDQDLFKEMERENRTRADLSPWEQGIMYRRALNDELFSSQEQLAREIGVDPGNLSKALRLADLPEAVVRAFPSPLDLQFRWAKALNDALQRDPEGVLERASELAANRSVGQSPKEVFEVLTGLFSDTPKEEAILVGGRIVAKIVAHRGEVSLHFGKGALSAEQAKRLGEIVKEFMST
ncbi:ParB/RepB/Spo0J family partition protein [Noviherbaspirillum sp. CPCC 100848]|uniref:ParB/RepB/Spo0J family partition protein n=1 Tax=Noviherbaspirillum album TaxID=3080276 RepID=A0ABU6J330_9BURK|nr:ParB/RepB/Spo0J family partition protein [Noviherbaspirillum sp. CPCC 100848]MEC4717928.1 ParB/RepB/Spo0J family partition protein [Noviherbaspirillum sp. CPCC 100848]